MQTTDIKMKGLTVIVWACLLGEVFVTVSSEKIKYGGNQLWKITNSNDTAIKLLKPLERKNYLSLWGKTAMTVDAMINARYLQDVKEELRKNHVLYEVSIKDIQNAIDEENPKLPILDNKHGQHLTWVYYHRLEDIYKYLQYLYATFPELCSLYTIGHSVESRPIKLLKISNNNPNNKAIFVEGGIHAREWISPATVTYIIHQFIYNNEDQPKYIQNFDWYFVPVLNPDGYEYSHLTDRLWRKNRAKFDGCIGVDLNRNWAYAWSKNGSSTNPCSNLYKGPKPFSEPETAAIADFFANNKHIKWAAYLSVHSYGQYIVYPWGYPDEVLEDFQEIDRIGKRAASTISATGGAFYTVGPAGTTIYKAAGTSMDWARGIEGVKYAYTIELRDRGRYGFLLPASFIKSTSEEALVFVRTIAEAAAST